MTPCPHKFPPYPRGFRLCYDGGMNASGIILTPVIRAALARPVRARAVVAASGEGGRGGKKSPHNYLAEAVQKPCGARPGNRNAARRPLDSAVRRACVRALLADTNALLKSLEAPRG